MARYGIVVDLNRCVGCLTCVINCKEENRTRPGVWWNQVLQLENDDKGRIVYVRYACMHCEDPPCVKACPNDAIYRRADGIVLVNQEKCAGIGECVKACPYDVVVLTPDKEYFAGDETSLEAQPAPHQVHPPGKASMCTLCSHRIDEGLRPICVAGCPSRAMTFGDLDDPDDPIRKKSEQSEALQASGGSRPKVTYVFPPGLQRFVDEEVAKDPRMIKLR